MRMIMLATVSAGLMLAGAANAQAPSQRAPASPPASAPQAPAERPAIKSVNVVDLDQLPDTTKAQVNEIVAKRTADELQRLQSAIEAAPAVKSAVEAKGFSSRDVVLAQMGEDGELTVVTRKAG